MPSSESAIPLDSFVTFGDLLKYLRRRARMTQRELCIAVGYSEAQISRLEQNQRPPDLAALTALFIPALYLEDEPLVVSRLMELAAYARGEELPQNAVLTFSSSVRREIKESMRTEESVQNNLPLQLTSFIGREHEIDEIKNLLDSNQGNARLVTLAGSGGCGKTRLALQTAQQLTDAYRNGAWLIELAPISNPAHVAQTFITSLGMPEPRDGSFINTIKKFLRAKHTLLVVDNCEHVISETANLIHEILAACPHVRILATSREILNIAGEVRFRVPSLLDSESLGLFADRAKTVLPSFELTEDNASRVAQICSRLDSIPLAIELAASRLNTLSLDQIASLLDDRFRLLTTGSRTDLPRQQTLRAAIDWSYDLLDDEDKKIFRSLCVFAGGFELKAAKEVIVESNSALDVITRFVDKSLVVVDRLSNGEIRYRLLETVREYCREKLQAAGEESMIRERHFRCYLAFAEESENGLRGKDQVEWMKRLEREHENLRAAMESALGDQSPVSAQSGLRLAISLLYFWFLRGYHDESRDWLKRFIQLPHQPRRTPEYAHALSRSGHWATDAKEAYRLFDESISLSYALENETAIAAAHFSRASYGWLEDDPSAGRLHFDKSIESYRKVGDHWNVARKLAEFGEFAQVRLNDRIAAWNAFEESLQLARELEDARGVAFALIRLGDLAIEQNKLEEANQFCSEGLIVAGELNDQESMAWGINDLGVIAICEGKLDEAEHLCAESLALSQEWGGGWHTIIRRYWLARVVVYQGDDARAIGLIEENIAESQQHNFDWGRAASLQGLGDAALRRRDLEPARSYHTEAITILHTGNYLYSLAYSLDSFASLALARNQLARALTLLFAADGLRESIHTALLPPETKEREQLITAIKEKINPDLITSLTAQGRAMTLNKAVEYALN